jgi:hypothetical protein
VNRARSPRRRLTPTRSTSSRPSSPSSRSTRGSCVRASSSARRAAPARRDARQRQNKSSVSQTFQRAAAATSHSSGGCVSRSRPAQSQHI